MLLRRLAVVVLPAVVAVPLLAGSASASCTDDLLDESVTSGYTPATYSPYWNDKSYVEASGIANVEVHGDALVSDGVTHAGDWANWTEIVSGNAVDYSVEFVNCVAG